MLVKIVRNETADTAECSELAYCTNVTKTVIREGSVAARDGSSVGIFVELGATEPGSPSRTIHLPTNGDVVYVMNDQGVTIDRISYDPSASRRRS